MTLITAPWVAKETLRVWINENPSGCKAPRPLTVILPSGDWGRASWTGAEAMAPRTLEVPVTPDMSLDQAHPLIRQAVRAALGVDWVRDGRHLMNGAA